MKINHDMHRYWQKTVRRSMSVVEGEQLTTAVSDSSIPPCLLTLQVGAINFHFTSRLRETRPLGQNRRVQNSTLFRHSLILGRLNHLFLHCQLWVWA